MDRLIPDSVAPTHDLIRLSDPTALTWDTPAPPWVVTTMRRIPWIVVRRGFIRNGLIPVGVRGPVRSQRFAAFVPVTEIADRLSPEDLTDAHCMIEPKRTHVVRALGAIERVKPILTAHGYCWGPGGSVGFELATSEAAATASSDLDLIVRLNRRLETSEASDLLATLTNAASPARVDVLLETRSGGVSLADLATTSAPVLVRTPIGPRLSVNPWMMDVKIPLEAAL
jgi:phosphoribosyl-dephospho-CoA transferase